MIDEDPSSEDIERFDRDTSQCPDCGAEVYDGADICPKCFAFIHGETSATKKASIIKRIWPLIVLALLASMVFIWLLTVPAGR